MKIKRNASIYLFILSLCVNLGACTLADNFMLGKDNSPKPEPLQPIKSKTKMVENWSTPIGKKLATNAYLKLKPVILANTIYTSDTHGQISSVDKSTGRINWSINVGEGVTSGLSIHEGHIALGTNRSNLIMLNEKNGATLWKTKVSSDILANPLISQDKVIVKTIDGNLYAFKVNNGEKIWVSDHGAPHLILKASASPVILGHTVLVGYSDGRLASIDIETGHTLWEKGIAYASGSSDIERLVDIDADPIVEGNVVYLATFQGYLGALSLTDGQFIWRKPASVYKNITFDDKNLYLTDSDDVIWAIQKSTGQVQWKQLSLKARGLTEPVLVGSRIVVGDKTGFLHTLSKQTGQLIGRAQLAGPIEVSPSVKGNHVYVLTSNGKLNDFSVG